MKQLVSKPFIFKFVAVSFSQQFHFPSGTAGAVTFGPAAGWLIDTMSSRSHTNDYTGVIVLYFALRASAAVLMCAFVSLDFKPPAKKVFRDLGRVFGRADVLAFLGAFFSAGLLWGFLETFLFWLLEDLGASKTLMGWSLAMGTVAGVPISIFSR